MDEMVLEPREGVKDERTRPDRNPWLQRPTLKLRKAYWRTVGRAIGYPTRLARGTPAESSTASALFFFLIHLIWISVLSAAPFAIILIATMPSIGHRSIWPMLTTLAMVSVAPSVYMFGMLFLWSFITHLVLRPLAGKRIRMGTTVKAFAYASPPILMLAVPCLGIYASVLALPWWIINSIAMVGAIHSVRWWRAMIAVVLGATIAIGAPVGALTYWIVHTVQQASQWRAASPQRAVGMFQTALALPPLGTPTHIADRIRNLQGYPFDFDSLAEGIIDHPEIRIAGYTLQDFSSLAPAQADPICVDLRAATLPSGIHRIGHLVVCDAGIDANAPQHPDVWLAIVSPDPDSGAALLAPGTINVIVPQDMNPHPIPLAQFPAELAAQNTLRQSLNLPQIPDPATIHMWPPGSQYGPAPAPPPTPTPQPAPVP